MGYHMMMMVMKEFWWLDPIGYWDGMIMEPPCSIDGLVERVVKGQRKCSPH